MTPVQPTDAGRVAFADLTAVRPTGATAFAADVHPEWTIDGRPNGGYLLALLGAAVLAASPHPDVLAASAHYLRSPVPGPVTLEVELLRAGRSASQLRARMRQDGDPCVEAVVTTARLDADAQPFWDRGAPELRDGDPADAIRVPAASPLGMRVAVMDQVDLRVDAATAGFGRGRPTGRGELWGWLSLPDTAAFDSLSLLYAVDSLPPATFDIELTGWVPTVELTCYVRAVPAPGPVRVMQRARLIDGRLVDEECWVWDVRGRVVAHGTQLAGIRLG